MGLSTDHGGQASPTILPLPHQRHAYGLPTQLLGAICWACGVSCTRRAAAGGKCGLATGGRTARAVRQSEEAGMDSPRTTPPSSPDHLDSQGDSGRPDVDLKPLLLEQNGTGRRGFLGTTKRTRVSAGAGGEKCTAPPTSPPGEAFANHFLHEYEDAGSMHTSAHVIRLARSRATPVVCTPRRT